MNGIIEEVEQLNDIKVHFVQTEKFKTMNIVVKFKAPLEKETITKRALLPYILRQGTETYPSEMEVQKRLDYLYGSSLSIDGTKKGNNHIISVRLEVANDKFIQGESSLIDDALHLLHEVIYKPKVIGDSFDPQIFAREKRTLRQVIESVIDDKMKYANMRLIDEMCVGERYALHVHGYTEDLEALTAEQLYAYYMELLEQDEVDLYVMGDFDQQEMTDKVTAYFKRSIKQQEKSVKQAQSITRTEPNIVIEKQEIQQAKLHIGYRTNCTFKDDDYYALQLFNGMLGGFPSSKLFLNVREKHSLAYYAASRIESHKGILLIFSGIDAKDYEKAKQIIEEQIEAMKSGDFTENDLAETKEQLTNQILETLDHPQGIIELLYQQVLANKHLPPNELIAQIKSATKDDIINVAQKVEEDTIYLLTSEAGEVNE